MRLHLLLVMHLTFILIRSLLLTDMMLRRLRSVLLARIDVAAG